MHNRAVEVTHLPAPAPNRFRHGMLIGLAPLGLLAALMAGVVGAMLLTRQLSVSQGFPVEQQVVVLVAGIGLASAGVVYAVACVLVLRWVRRWQGVGERAVASGALWGLGIAALIVVLPILLAVFMPSHPAPVL